MNAGFGVLYVAQPSEAASMVFYGHHCSITCIIFINIFIYLMYNKTILFVRLLVIDFRAVLCIYTIPIMYLHLFQKTKTGENI